MNKNKLLAILNLSIKIFSLFAAVGGIIQTVMILMTPDINLKSILLSFPAWVIYVLILLTIILILLKNKYKSISNEVEYLNLKLKEQNAHVVSLQEMMKIPSFKNRFYLTTEYLYNNLAEYIQNNISINTIQISNTIEKKGSGDKRNSNVQLWVQGILTKRMTNFQLLVAGDTIVDFENLNMNAFDYKAGQKIGLPIRIADSGYDSMLKQVVVSYNKVKEKGENLDLLVTWSWPNMLSIKDCDYITLPNFLSQNVKHMKITLTNKNEIYFKTASIYKYKVGMTCPEFVKDIDISSGNNSVSYEEINPLDNSCYILYYEL